MKNFIINSQFSTSNTLIIDANTGKYIGIRELLSLKVIFLNYLSEQRKYKNFTLLFSLSSHLYK